MNAVAAHLVLTDAQPTRRFRRKFPLASASSRIDLTDDSSTRRIENVDMQARALDARFNGSIEIDIPVADAAPEEIEVSGVIILGAHGRKARSSRRRLPSVTMRAAAAV